MSGAANTFTSMLPDLKEVYGDKEKKKKAKVEALKKIKEKK